MTGLFLSRIVQKSRLISKTSDIKGSHRDPSRYITYKFYRFGPFSPGFGFLDLFAVSSDAINGPEDHPDLCRPAILVNKEIVAPITIRLADLPYYGITSPLLTKESPYCGHLQVFHLA